MNFGDNSLTWSNGKRDYNLHFVNRPVVKFKILVMQTTYIQSWERNYRQVHKIKKLVIFFNFLTPMPKSNRHQIHAFQGFSKKSPYFLGFYVLNRLVTRVGIRASTSGDNNLVLFPLW